MTSVYRLFSWEHSYFSGKVRAYLRFKQSQGELGPGYEDILATPELIQGLLIPRSGSGAVPQLEAPDGHWVQDSSEIIDFCEATHPNAPVVPDAALAPRQCLAVHLIELLADEWIVVPVVPDAFVVNCGELLRHWSNDRFLSARHFVDNPGSSSRYSIPFFFNANADHVMQPLASCFGPGNPLRYPPVSYRQSQAAAQGE